MFLSLSLFFFFFLCLNYVFVLGVGHMALTVPGLYMGTPFIWFYFSVSSKLVFTFFFSTPHQVSFRDFLA